LKTFESGEKCEQYIQNHADERIVLIVSANLGRYFVPVIHGLKQIVAILFIHRT